MANFTGTVDEYHRFIGPRIRNHINYMARRERNARDGVCEICNERNGYLETAHVSGRGRRKIVEEVISNYITNNGIIFCDLQDVEKLIWDSHLPIENNIKFLCHRCHTLYDTEDNSNLFNEENTKQVNDDSTPEGLTVNIYGHALPLYREQGRTNLYLFKILPVLIDRLPKEELNSIFLSKEGSSKVFRMSYPVLTVNSNDVLDRQGYRRYYPNAINNTYYVCNDWYTRNLERMAEYLVELSRRAV